MTTIFHGTEAETRDLLEAVRRSCTCFLVGGTPDGSCSAHRMLVDQRALDGLLFARRAHLERMLEQEHTALAEFDAFRVNPHQLEDQ